MNLMKNDIKNEEKVEFPLPYTIGNIEFHEPVKIIPKVFCLIHSEYS